MKRLTSKKWAEIMQALRVEWGLSAEEATRTMGVFFEEAAV